MQQIRDYHAAGRRRSFPTRTDYASFFHDARACVATWMTNALVPDVLIRRFLGQTPRGAAEARYTKGNILPAMMDAVLKIKLTWGEE